MNNKKFSANRMILAMLAVQIFSIICIILLKYNMDVFSSQYREEEAKYQDVLYNLENLSRNIYLHEGYVTKHFMTYDEDVQVSYETNAKNIKAQITKGLVECNLAIEDLGDEEEKTEYQTVCNALTSYFNCADIAFIISKDEDIDICEFLNNYYLEYYAEDANDAIMSLESDIKDNQDVIKNKMKETMSVIKMSFILGVLGIFIATIVCISYCYRLLKVQDIYMQEADSASQAKTKFLSNMSHEIRTPINTVIGLNEMILREPGDQAAVTGYALDVKNAGNMLLSLVNGILDLSKIEAGLMELSPVEYELASLLNDVRSIIKPKFDAKNLKFKIDVSENLPLKLYGDDIRIRQVLINVLTNACKYTDKGYVKLSIYGEINDDVAHLNFIVQDTGIGMKPEDLQKLSTRFARFDEKKNRNVEGTGIGMDITCNFLKMMDSELCVESEYGKGSKFYFYLQQKVIDDTPIGNLTEAFKQASKGEAYEASFIAPKAKVLVVDDNTMNINVFVNLLKETQIGIHSATSGKEALEFTKKEKYDLIFMDHMMPEMDGIEARERIVAQEDGLNRETKIIALTANALSGAREEYAKLGFDNFLAKPIQPEKLENMIRTMLPEELVEKAERKKKAAQPATAENMDILPNIAGVDNDYAVGHNGSPEAVLGVMKTFLDMAATEENALAQFYDQLSDNPEDGEAIDNYRIKVHSMKSSAGLIGALQVYGAAAHLEYEAREKNVQAVLDITPYFLTFWEKLAGELAEFFKAAEPEEEVEKKAINSDEVINLLEQLILSMQNYDIAGSDGLIKKLEERDFGQEEKALFDKLKLCVANLDAPGCQEIGQQLIEFYK